jgi:hypothetical protein
MQDRNLPYVYGPYDRLKTLKEIANNMFGVSFYNLKPEMLGNNMEFAQIEMIVIGLIPLFDYDYGSNLKINGTPLKDIPYFGLFLKKDLSNAEEVAQKMVEIANSEELFNKYLETSLSTIAQYNKNNAFIKTVGYLNER